jgi:spore maturation protein CgeB
MIFMEKTQNRKILFAVPSDSHFYQPINGSLEKLGFKVYHFDYRKNTFLEKCVFAFTYINPKFRNYVIKMRNKRLIRLMKNENIKTFLSSKGELISADTIKKLREMGVVTINWFSDLIPYFPFMENIMKEYDYVFTPDNDDIKNYKKSLNLYLLPYGGPYTTSKPNFRKRKHNVTFIGAISKEREEMIYELKDFKPTLWGDKKWASSKVSEFYGGEWLTPQQVLELLQESKIAINIHRFAVSDGSTPNIRVFEATANGALLLTDYRRDLAKYFNIKGKNKEVIVYKDFEELKKLIKYYLTHEQERIAIAKKGWKRSFKDHTYDKRVNQMLKVAKIL